MNSLYNYGHNLDGNKLLDIIQYISDNPTCVDHQDYWGTTPLMYAIETRKKVDLHDGAIIKALIYKKANVNIQDIYGKTALMYAVTNNDKDIVKILLDSGADVNLKSNAGLSALMHCTLGYNTNNYLPILLLEKGADVDNRTFNVLLDKYRSCPTVLNKIFSIKRRFVYKYAEHHNHGYLISLDGLIFCDIPYTRQSIQLYEIAKQQYPYLHRATRFISMQKKLIISDPFYYFYYNFIKNNQIITIFMFIKNS